MLLCSHYFVGFYWQRQLDSTISILEETVGWIAVEVPPHCDRTQIAGDTLAPEAETKQALSVISIGVSTSPQNVFSYNEKRIMLFFKLSLTSWTLCESFVSILNRCKFSPQWRTKEDTFQICYIIGFLDEEKLRMEQ